MAIVVVVAVH